MKKLFKHFKENLISSIAGMAVVIATGMLALTGGLSGKTAVARSAVANQSGEGYIDSAVKILIAVVLGALLLAGLYLLFGETVMPTLTQRIKDMFNYTG